MADLLAAVDIVGTDAGLVERAAAPAFEQELRGDDAMHRAAVESLRDPALVVASGDRHLLAALSAVGLDTVDTSVR